MPHTAQATHAPRNTQVHTHSPHPFHTHTPPHQTRTHTHTPEPTAHAPNSPISTAANSAAMAEAGSLGWVSHGPKVPSTLKFLEGVEVSFLFSLEFFHFLFLRQESQVSQLPESAPPTWVALFQVSAMCQPHATYTCRLSLPRPHFTVGGARVTGGQRSCLWPTAPEPGRLPPAAPLAASQNCCHFRWPPNSQPPGASGAERSPRAPPTLPPPSATTCHLAPVERFIPVIDDRGRTGQPAVLNGVPTDSGHLAVPRQNCKPDTATSGPGWVPVAPRLPFQNQAAQTRLLYPDHSTCVTASSWRTWTRREGPGEGQRGLRWATVRILSLKRRHR